MLERGKNGATVLAINGDNYINAYNDSDTITISKMYSEADEITQFIDNNIYTGEKGTLYTNEILTLPEQYRTEEYIEKFAKAITLKLAIMIKNSDIVRTNNIPLNISVISISIDITNGNVYYGLSGSSSNPTRDLNNINELINERIQSVIQWANDKNNGIIPQQRGKDNIKSLKNCAEFNAINNALNDEINFQNLVLYSINYNTQCFIPPCYNCQALYLNHINKFIDFDENSPEYYDKFDYNNY